MTDEGSIPQISLQPAMRAFRLLKAKRARLAKFFAGDPYVEHLSGFSHAEDLYAVEALGIKLGAYCEATGLSWADLRSRIISAIKAIDGVSDSDREFRDVVRGLEPQDASLSIWSNADGDLTLQWTKDNRRLQLLPTPAGCRYCCASNADGFTTVERGPLGKQGARLMAWLDSGERL